MKIQTPISNRWLTLFFALLLAIQTLYMVIGFASIPLYFHRVTTQTVEPVIIYGAVQISNESVAQLAAERGLSLRQYAAYRSTLDVSLAALVPLVVAALIVWRARWRWFAWYTAFIIVFLGQSFLDEQMLVAQTISAEIFGARAIFWFMLLPYFFLFPNGKAAPRGAAWLVGALVLYHFLVQVGTVLAYVAPDFALRLNLPNWGTPVFIWPVLLNFVVILACQVYRYRRVSTPSERQQTKWFLFAFALTIAQIVVSVLASITERSGFLFDIAEVVLWMPFFFSLAIAITRYRLFDIDVIIRKTLQYGVLSALLALVYFGSVVLLQTLFGPVMGDSPLLLVLSTLLIAAIFNPLRRRVQNLIDRSFYRRKYDASQVLARFAQVAQNEVEMEKLLAALVGVVEETIEPQTISLWLVRSETPRRIHHGE